MPRQLLAASELTSELAGQNEDGFSPVSPTQNGNNLLLGVDNTLLAGRGLQGSRANSKQSQRPSVGEDQLKAKIDILAAKNAESHQFAPEVTHEYDGHTARKDNVFFGKSESAFLMRRVTIKHRKATSLFMYSASVMQGKLLDGMEVDKKKKETQHLKVVKQLLACVVHSKTLGPQATHSRRGRDRQIHYICSRFIVTGKCTSIPWNICLIALKHLFKLILYIFFIVLIYCLIRNPVSSPNCDQIPRIYVHLVWPVEMLQALGLLTFVMRGLFEKQGLRASYMWNWNWSCAVGTKNRSVLFTFHKLPQEELCTSI